MGDLIPHSRPTLGEEEAQAAADAVRSGQIAEGPRVAALESALAKYLGRQAGVATSSGLAALHLALHALRIGEGDAVVVPSYNCPALAHAVRQSGGSLRLCDVDPASGNPTPETVGAVAEGARAIIVTHLFGSPAEAADIAALGPPVVEDLAQALGARGGGKMAGTAGVLSVCSFYATKLIAAGEGGMVLGDEAEIISRARDAHAYDEREDIAPRWNYKLTDIQAAVALVQLGRYEEFVARRREIATRYTEALAGCGLGLPVDPAGGRHVYHRYIVRLPGHWTARHGDEAVSEAIRAFERKGVSARRPIYRPLHHLLGEGGFPGAEAAWRSHISLPIYPSLTETELETIIGSTKAIFAS